jgi:hypothetical protein
MPEAPELEVQGIQSPLVVAVAVRFADDLPEEEYVVKTSPFDKMRYPIGEYSVNLLMRNVDRIFQSAAKEGSPQPGGGEAVAVLELKIENFDAVIPRPAYKPYTAEVVYRASVFDLEGNKLFTVVTTGSAQTSKGMMSGFKAKRLAAESAAQAMNDAMTQLLEGLLCSEELKALALSPSVEEEGS